MPRALQKRLETDTEPVFEPVLGEGLTWYCVMSNINCQQKAAEGIQRSGYVPYVAVETRWVRHAKKKEAKRYPLLDRYIFVGVRPGQLFLMRGIDGVEKVVRFSEHSRPTQEKVIARLWSAEQAGLFDHTKQSESIPAFVVGQTVEIADGAFRGFLATVSKTLPKDKVELLLNVFGRQSVSVCRVEQLQAA